MADASAVAEDLPFRVEPGAPLALGELTIERADDGFVLRGPRGTGALREVMAGDLREHVRFDDEGRYRPLTGGRSLPSGWSVRLASEPALAEAIEAVYPLALAHLSLAAAGTLRVAGYDALTARQRGRYRVAGGLSAGGQAAVRELLCGQCVKAPRWAEVTPAPAQIPCPEPCSVFLALAREAAIWERDGVQPHPVDPGAAFAAFEEAGNAIREAVIARLRPAGRA